MMKKLLLSCFLLQAGFAISQVVPNAYFEGWNSSSTNVPKNWQVFGKTSKVAGKTTGSAIRLVNDKNTGTVSYAFQSVFDTSSLFLRGSAFAFGNTPDSMTLTYRAALGSDTAFMQVAFTKSGEIFPVTFDEYELTGTSGAWRTITLPVTYSSLTDSLKADSGWIYIQSADEFVGPSSNGYIEIDDITFIFKNHTTAGTVPNEGFENWDNFVLEQPDGWGTSALFLKNGGLNLNHTTRTSDKNSGNYAIKLHAFVITDPISLVKDTFPGFAITVHSNGTDNAETIDIESPSFPVSQRYQSIRGFLKSDLKAGDQAMVTINFFKADSIVGSAVFSDPNSHSAFTSFSEDIAWDSSFSGTPDSATILLLVSDSTQEKASSVNSWAIFDDLKLDNFSTGLLLLPTQKLQVQVFPNPSNGAFTVLYDATVAGKTEIRLHNLNGQEVFNTAYEASSGRNLIPMNIAAPAAGFYTLTVQSSTGIYTQKILITP